MLHNNQQMETETDYYTVLHLKPGSSLEEIRKQYRRLAKVYHPDRNPGEEEWCAEQLTKVNRAYEFLSNRERKAVYDKVGGTPGATAAGWAQSGERQYASARTAASSQPPPQPTPHDYSPAKSVPVARRHIARPTLKQTAIMLAGGTGVGALLGILVTGVFAYLHPTQSHELILPVPAPYQSSAQVAATPSVDSGLALHRTLHVHHRKVALEGATSTQSEVAHLNRLGIQVPAGQFSKQQLHDIALRLEQYDRTH